MNRKTAPSLVPGTLLLTAFLLCTGCISPGRETQGPGGADTRALEGTAWDLVSSLSGNGTEIRVLPNTRITAVFSPGGKLAGSAGCNHYFGDYGTDGSSLTMGGMGSTLMACVDPGVMDQESRYLSLLGSAAQFRIDGDRLILSDASGTAVLTYEKERPLTPLPLTGTAWVLESWATGNGSVSSVLAGTVIDALFSEDGKVSGSAGCNRYFADFNRAGTSLRFGPVGSTKMYCNEPQGRMEQEQAYLSLLGTVAGFEINGNRLILKDSQGSLILSFRAA